MTHRSKTSVLVLTLLIIMSLLVAACSTTDTDDDNDDASADTSSEQTDDSEDTEESDTTDDTESEGTETEDSESEDAESTEESESDTEDEAEASDEGDSEETAADDSDFPSETITMIVPFGAGGGTDTQARALSSVAGDYLGVPVQVEIREGGSGVIGLTYVKNEVEPDGHTLVFLGTSANTSVPYSQDLEYHPIDDFEWIAGVTSNIEVLAVRSDFPADTTEEFIQYIQENPGEVQIGHSGTGGEDWVAVRLMENAFETEITDVPFDGSGESSQNAAGGHIDGAATSLAAATPFIESGDLKVIATFTEAPVSELNAEFSDGVVSFNEIGHDVVVNSRIGVGAPKGVPEDRLQFLEDAFKQTMEDPAFTSLAENLGLNIEFKSGEEFRELVRAEYERMAIAFEEEE